MAAVASRPTRRGVSNAPCARSLRPTRCRHTEGRTLVELQEPLNKPSVSISTRAQNAAAQAGTRRATCPWARSLHQTALEGSPEFTGGEGHAIRTRWRGRTKGGRRKRADGWLRRRSVKEMCGGERRGAAGARGGGVWRHRVAAACASRGNRDVGGRGDFRRVVCMGT